MPSKIKCLITILLILLTGAGKAQVVREILNEIKPAKKYNGIPALQKRSQVVYAGVGAANNVATLIKFADIIPVFFGGSTSNYGKAGPIIAGYEYFIKDDVGIGINLGYAKAGKKYTNGNTQYKAQLTAYTIAVFSSYHLYTTDKLDPYVKGAVGINLWSSKATGTNIPLPTPFSYNALLGLRYFVTPNWAPFGELGYSSLKFTANIGAAYKIK